MLHELTRPLRCASSSSSLPPFSEKEEEYFRLGEEFYARELKKCKPLDPRSYTDVVGTLCMYRLSCYVECVVGN